MIKDLIILALVGYLIYKVMSRFVLPIVRVTNIAHDHVNRMQEQMQAQMQEMQRQQQMNQQPQNRKANTVDGDYIDYEEV